MKYVAILLFSIIVVVTVDSPGIKGNQHCSYCKGSCLQCITGYYGDYCNMTCTCSEGQQCDRKSGTCTDEVTRYSVSDLKSWSYNCSDCNGTCKECVPGWYGEKCTLKCINCTIDGCNKTTGFCEFCKYNFYRPNCDKPCPPHCRTGKDETSCRRENGSCHDGCEEGWKGDRCTHQIHEQNRSEHVNECKHGHYGQTCNLTCSSGCMNQTCHYDGTCFDGCKEGFSGKFCNICAVSFYGPKCDERCAPWCVNHTCSRNGSCECLAVYTGVKCDIESLDWCFSRPYLIGTTIVFFIGFIFGYCFRNKMLMKTGEFKIPDEVNINSTEQVYKVLPKTDEFESQV